MVELTENHLTELEEKLLGLIFDGKGKDVEEEAFVAMGVTQMERMDEDEIASEEEEDVSNDSEDIENIEWLGTKEQLVELNKTLQELNLLSNIKDTAFLSHFKNQDGDNYEKQNFCKLNWLGKNYLSAVLMQELVSNKLIPNTLLMKVYKILGNHFKGINPNSLAQLYSKRKLNPSPEYLKLQEAIKKL